MAELELTEYRKGVETYLKEDSPVIFGNYTKEHAACVVELFTRSARKNIDLLSGCYPSSFYGNITELLQAAANRDVKVRIITLCNRVDERLNSLDRNNSNIEYRPGRLIGDKPVSHFMVVDGKRYRLEAPHQESDPETVKAEICCNGVKKASELEDLFNAVWGILKPGAVQ
ncbi:hypothetical protein [Victivallis vadensis]|uniref:hypothetical protein n=1 Tax=Victivallis vadensis TaxID=172901 RepID=UPI00307D3DDA